MRWGVVTFPGSNDDHDALHAVGEVLGGDAVSLWHGDRDLKGADCVILPGGFSYGDYLRCGALARFSPVMESIATFARDGGYVIGICNGFQILCEAGLLPGALIANRSLRFICNDVHLRVERTDLPFTCNYTRGQVVRIPVKHGEGCYIADPTTLSELEEQRQVVFRYVDALGEVTAEVNCNGSLHNIAGIVNRQRNVLGMMPHAEHAVERLLGGDDGIHLFRSVMTALSDGYPGQASAVSDR
ncbi:MAG TPA: phosphoribosylformylglycinamidine synthase subunit PurQ [Terriglobales bacterium]|nr:phosphoribosylformylglycinamidine synthase subunit PurQ [Terriglobales bacterium]